MTSVTFANPKFAGEKQTVGRSAVLVQNSADSDEQQWGQRMQSRLLPDLWLKMELALALATILPKDSAAPLVNSEFIRYVRGDGDRLSTFNKWLVGDAALKTGSDVPLMSAMLYRMVQEGIAKSDNHDTFKADAANPERLALHEPLLGTAFDFAAALVAAVAGRRDLGNASDKLDAVMRKALFKGLVETSERSGPITIIHGETRDWVRSGSERLANNDDVQRVPYGHFIQYIVPPAAVDRLVFGFEMLSDRSLVGAEWADTANWFAPKTQLAGEALLLLDEPVDDGAAYRASGLGESVVQVVGVDLDFLSTTDSPAPTKGKLPHDLYKLIGNVPDSWPDGYAETIAMMTYVSRLALRRTKAEKKRAEAAVGASGTNANPIPPRAQLHQGRYQVV